MKITRLRIGLLSSDQVTEEIDENNYWAEAIDDGEKYYYRADGTTIQITDEQYRKVISNPYLYYFSTALKLHLEVKRVRGRLPPQ